MKCARAYLQFIYHLWAMFYDRYLDRFFSFDRASIIHALHLEKNDRVLEIGVGTGLNLPFYPPLVSVVGVDFSEAMLRRARKKLFDADVKLVHADAMNLDVADNYFTHAVATFVIRVSPSPAALMQALARVVEPGGTLVILDQFGSWNWFFSPIKLLLGWGKDIQLENLLLNSSWKIVMERPIKNRANTKLLVLRNEKTPIH